jgi:hypothetical protein
MTSEQKVKHVYPDAVIGGFGSVTHLGITMIVYTAPDGRELARIHQRRRSWAWASAWETIQKEKLRKGEA